MSLAVLFGAAIFTAVPDQAYSQIRANTDRSLGSDIHVVTPALKRVDF